MEDEYLSVMTSGLNIAEELIKKQKPTVTLVGGQFNRNTLSASGISSAQFIREVNIDIAFMATSGFSMENGFTSGIYTESELKKEVIHRARKTIMLMDSSKIDKIMTFTFAYLDDIDILISDDDLDPEIKKEAERRGIQVV